MIRNLLIDLGGVLINLDRPRCVEKFKTLGLTDIESALGLSDKQDFLQAFETGLITGAQFRDEIRRRIGRPVTDGAIDDAWNSFLRDIPSYRLDMLLMLRRKYRVCLLSNTNEIHWLHVCRNLFRYGGHRPDDFFDRLFLSYEMKMAKPDIRIFREVLAATGFVPEETLFIDDSAANCRAAAGLGIETYTPKPLSPNIATIGFFDGFHLGHRHLIGQLREAAAARQLSSAVVTFPLHPRLALQPRFRPSLLTTCEEKLRLLAQTGVDHLLPIPFTPATAQLSARAFMTLLKERYAVRALLIGYDHRFGRDRAEGFDDYVRYGRELGMEVIRASRLPLPEVSSSVIRRLIGEGDVTEAARRLGYPYFLEGTVVAGCHVGRKIGYPTANLRPADPCKLIPADGVYAVRVTLAGREWGGMLNIGCRPTMENGSRRSIEVHLFRYTGSAYRQTMRITFVRRIRPEIKFPNPAALTLQLQHDEKQSKEILREE